MTFMCGKRLNSWKTIWALVRILRIFSRSAVLRCSRSGSAATLTPSTSTVPAVGSSRKLMQRSNVLLPEPDRPIRQIVSRGYTSSEQPRRTWLWWKYFSSAAHRDDGHRAGRCQGSGRRIGVRADGCRAHWGPRSCRSSVAVSGGHPLLEACLEVRQDQRQAPVDEGCDDDRLEALTGRPSGGLGAPQQLLDADDRDERGVLRHRDEVVAHRRA